MIKVEGELKSLHNEVRLFIAKVKDMDLYKPFTAAQMAAIVPDYRDPTFNEALALYLKGQQMLSRSSTDPYQISSDKTSKRLDGKLPYQVRIFRK